MLYSTSVGLLGAEELSTFSAADLMGIWRDETNPIKTRNLAFKLHHRGAHIENMYRAYLTENQSLFYRGFFTDDNDRVIITTGKTIMEIATRFRGLALTSKLSGKVVIKNIRSMQTVFEEEL